MAIDEIEIPGTSIALKCWNARIDNIPEFFKRLSGESDAFTLEPEIPGFHDCDANKRLIRGFYSGVVPFEVEHLVEGISTKTLFKRIESTEFLLLDNCMFTMGKSGPTKGLSNVISATSGYGASLMEFEFRQMSQLQDRLSQTKSIVLTNPKDKEVRRARLAGLIESYTEYNVIDPRNHGIESAAGLVDSPLGPMTITVSRKGGLRLTVKKGFILTIDCLIWLISLIRDEQPPVASTNGGASAARIA
ncbi:MAG TPA: hypothetical protein PKM25_09325 [Candidatus Ozemobacteraceae bacterium]|nr:hypothetical protein [Candidatus Ozemobacteraceae bacterium]